MRVRSGRGVGAEQGELNIGERRHQQRSDHRVVVLYGKREDIQTRRVTHLQGKEVARRGVEERARVEDVMVRQAVGGGPASPVWPRWLNSSWPVARSPRLEKQTGHERGEVIKKVARKS